MNDNKPMTVAECQARVAECHEMAERAPIPEHRAMLRNLADAWQQLCEEMKKVQR